MSQRAARISEHATASLRNLSAFRISKHRLIGSRSCFYILGDGARLRDRKTVLLDALDMEADRLAQLPLRFRNSFAGGDTARQARHIGGIIVDRPFDYD